MDFWVVPYTLLLRGIRRAGEKALLFIRNLKMQDILKRVIDAEFGFDVDILNGQLTRQHSTKGLKNTRKAIVDRFRSSEGFKLEE